MAAWAGSNGNPSDSSEGRSRAGRRRAGCPLASCPVVGGRQRLRHETGRAPLPWSSHAQVARPPQASPAHEPHGAERWPAGFAPRPAQGASGPEHSRLRTARRHPTCLRLPIMLVLWMPMVLFIGS